MAMTIGMGQRSLGALVPESFREIGAVLGLKIDLATDPVSFGFRRERRDGVWGWGIDLHIGKLCICDHPDHPWSPDLPFPRRRVEAERWVVAFCARIGIEPWRNVEDENIRKRCRKAKRVEQAEARRAAFRIIPGGA